MTLHGVVSLEKRNVSQYTGGAKVGSKTAREIKTGAGWLFGVEDGVGVEVWGLTGGYARLIDLFLNFRLESKISQL